MAVPLYEAKAELKSRAVALGLIIGGWNTRQKKAYYQGQ